MEIYQYKYTDIASSVGCQSGLGWVKGGIHMQGGEGEAQGNQSFKLIVTRYLVVAGKEVRKRMDDRPYQ